MEDYFKVIMGKIDEYKSKGITVKYIISFNRGVDPKLYNEIFDILDRIDNWKQYIVGVDFSGDMNKG